MIARSFHPHIRLWDPFAREAACAAQVLYMAGKLDYPFDTAAFDRRIGRQPGTLDLNLQSYRAVVAAGIKMAVVWPYAAEDVLRPDSWRRVLRQLGLKTDVIERYMQAHYPALQQRQRATREIVASSPLATEVQKQLAPEDITRLLRSGAVVYCTFLSHQGKKIGCLLHTANRPSDRVHVFDPRTGVSNMQLSYVLNAIQYKDSGIVVYEM